MTVAAHRSPAVRLAASVLAMLVCLVVGILTLLAFGVGAAFFLFALAAVAAVDAGLTVRRSTIAAGEDHRSEPLPR